MLGGTFRRAFNVRVPRPMEALMLKTAQRARVSTAVPLWHSGRVLLNASAPRVATVCRNSAGCIAVTPSIFGQHVCPFQVSSFCVSARIATKSVDAKGAVQSSLKAEASKPEAEGSVADDSPSSSPSAKTRVSFRLIWSLIDWGLLLVGVALTLCSVGIAVLVPAR